MIKSTSIPPIRYNREGRYTALYYKKQTAGLFTLQSACHPNV